jgi:CheY-like chemotaxis protein
MISFNILIVDDEPDQVENYKAMCEEHERVAVFTATRFEEAKSIIQTTFLNLALVDLDFRGQAVGPQLLAFLKDYRPACKCILITRRPAEHQEDILKLFNPLRPLADALIDKRTWQPTLKEFLVDQLRDLLRTPIDLQSDCDLLDEVTAKMSSDKVSITSDEIDYLLHMLHSEGQAIGAPDSAISRVSISTMTGGRSSSVVLRCQPHTFSKMKGIWTVVKISRRADAEEEYRRYLRYVRFFVSLETRVELLGYVSGDTLGALCYSFAGKTPSVVLGLNDLFVDADERATLVLNRLFDPEAQSWYAMSGKPVAITDFLNQAYSIRTDKAIRVVEDTFRELQAQYPATEYRDGELNYNGIHVPSPLQTFGSGKLRRSYKTCIVHGDFNANNIITGEDGRAIMIDFRHTSIGPRALDFAGLEGSIRIGTVRRDTTVEHVLKAFRQERVTWRRNWDPDQQFSPIDPDIPYWRKISSQLASLAKMNFPDLSALEYACTCFGWSVRMLRVQLSFEQRLRLVCWMGHLSYIIEHHDLQLETAASGKGT